MKWLGQQVYVVTNRTQLGVAVFVSHIGVGLQLAFSEAVEHLVIPYMVSGVCTHELISWISG